MSDLIKRHRERTGALITVRPRVSWPLAVVMSLLFAAIATPLVMGDSLLESASSLAVTPGKPAPVTVRIPQFRGFEDGSASLRGGAVIVSRNTLVTDDTAALVSRVRAAHPSGLGVWIAYFAGLFLLSLLYTTNMRRSHAGRLVRTQAVTLLLLLGIAVAIKVALTLSALSVLVVPVAAIALVAALAVDASAGLATALVAAFLIGLLTPFDMGVLSVLMVQAVSTTLVLGRATRSKRSHIIMAGTMGGAAAAVAYFVFFYLSFGETPMHELGAPLTSAWVAALMGGVLSGFVAIPAKPIYQWLLGEITRNKLVELEDLSNPILQQIAENSPGTWQHSLAMANMAEVAANAIGANGRLVRVGAYYHDLGKSLQPTYFIENLQPGEKSPHDRLAPETSTDAIFAHVTEGVRLARKHGLPERVIDFMHMHHGDGVLEYFWGKCKEQGNPKQLTVEDFRYPGIPPQTRETAILAIVDAVEAASRTLRKPDEHAINTLVQRIVYGKLHLGQLDESGLSVADLRRISNSLIKTITHAFHGRIEYPWQRKEREEREGSSTTAPERPRTPSEIATLAVRAISERSMTERIIEEPRLDSLDVPRPYWRERTSPKAIENAATERVSGEHPSGSTPVRAPSPAPAPAPAPAKQDQPVDPIDDTVMLTKRKEDRADTDPEPDLLAAVATTLPALEQPPAPQPVASDDAAALVKQETELEQTEPEQTALEQTELEQTEEPSEDFENRVTSPRVAIPPPTATPAPLLDMRPPSRTLIGTGESQSVTPPKAPARVLADLVATARAEHQSVPRITPEPSPETAAAQPAAPAPAIEPPRRLLEPDSSDESGEMLAEWEDALHTAGRGVAPPKKRRPPPPPRSRGNRAPRSTIELMKGDAASTDGSVAAKIDGAEVSASPETRRDALRATARADSENAELLPGTMVIGPPPATKT